jgi:hypothetical protein
MTGESFVYNYKTQNGSVIESDASLTYQMFAKAELQFVESIEHIAEKHSEMNDGQAYLYRILIRHYKRLITNNNLTREAASEYRERMMKTNYMLKDLEPSYTAEPVPEVPQVKSSSGCCYVATAVYGSYDCPEVWTLRRFRDNSLAETWYGRAFVKTYYAISPTLVKWFGHTEWFKKMWRGTLDRMVKKLQTKGFESTPYQDKEW